MTLLELKKLIDKKITHYPKDAEVILDGQKLDGVVDLWLCANKKVAIVGTSTIADFAAMEDD